jgi:hypothetical protein
MTPKRGSVLLLVASALLFAGWIGWLAYLAIYTSRPEVLLRPQFLAAQVDVSAELSGGADRPDGGAVVKEVLWARDGAPAVDEKIDIVNLRDAARELGWTGPGRYILPLVKIDSAYRIAPVPRSPGFSGSNLPHIYRDTPETHAEHRQIRKE